MGSVPFPVIVGCHRSGTTLLRAMLDSHPDLAVVHESRFIPALAALHAGTPPFRQDEFVDDLIVHPSFARLGLDAGAVRTAVAQACPQGFADALRAVFAAYASAAGKRRAGDKTPEYVLRIPLIAETLPESRFVHVIRDGRDVAVSTVAAPLGPTDLGDAASTWANIVTAGRRDGSRLGPTRYLELRYERLVDEPATALNEVCVFLELDYADAMLSYHERADEIVRTAGMLELHDAIKKLPTPNLRDWRRDLGAAEVHRIEVVAGSTLTELGYELSGGLVPRPRRPWARRQHRAD